MLTRIGDSQIKGMEESKKGGGVLEKKGGGGAGGRGAGGLEFSGVGEMREPDLSHLVSNVRKINRKTGQLEVCAYSVIGVY